MLNRPMRILLWSSNIWYFGEGMFGPLFAVFAERIGGNILDITWAWAVYLLMAGIISIFSGRWTDEFDKRSVLVLGYALNTIFTFMYIFVSQPWHLLLVQAGIGMAGALATPPWDALYSEYETKKSDGFAWGIADGSANIVMAIAILVGGYVVVHFSFTLLFIIMGCIQFVGTLYMAKLYYQSKPKKKR